MTSTTDLYDKWHAAFLKLLEGSKHGIQVQLAEYCNKSSKYIGDIKLQRFNKTNGQPTKASPELQAKIASFFNMSLESMIQMGDGILNPTEQAPFPFHNDIMSMKEPEKRALAIARSAANEYGLERYMPDAIDFHLFPIQPGTCNRYVEDYLSGVINEKELYQGLLALFATVEIDIKHRLRRERLTSG